jgi:hypothetical protein
MRHEAEPVNNSLVTCMLKALISRGQFECQVNFDGCMELNLNVSCGVRYVPKVT